MGKANGWPKFIRIMLAYLVCASCLIALPTNSLANNGKINVFAQNGQEEEVVVKLNNSANIDTINAQYGTRTVKKFDEEKTYLLAAPNHNVAVNLTQALVNNREAEYVEPNYKLFATEAQQIFIYYDTSGGSINPTEFLGNQWAFNRLDVARSHTLSKGENTTVAVVDTGVSADHPELMNRVLAGYNTIDNSNNAHDDNGHGTFVAGIVSQVAPAAKILPIKALSNEGEGTVFDAVEAIRYAADQNVQVINLSLGLYQESKLLESAVKYAQSKEVVIVASAGNSATGEKRYPAALPGVVGVAATNEEDQKAGFSNYAKNSSVTAPGVKINSLYYTGGYAHGEGTSFAAPFVAGLAAQVWAKDRTAKAKDITKKIEHNASSLKKVDPDFGHLLGYGLINNYKTLLD